MKETSQPVAAETGVALYPVGSVILCEPGHRFQMRWRNGLYVWRIESYRLFDITGRPFVWAAPVAHFINGEREACIHAPLVCHLDYLAKHAVVTTDAVDSPNTKLPDA